MKNIYKIATGSVLTLSLVFVTSCGQPPKADSNSVLTDARTNFANYITGNFATDMHLSESGQSKGTFTANITSESDKLNAKVNGTFDGSQQAVQSGTGMTLNSQVGLNLSANVDSTSFKGEGKLDAELRVLGEKLYVVLNDLTVNSADQAIQTNFDSQIKPFLTLYSKKWFFLDLVALGGSSAQVKIDAAAYAKIAEQVKAKELFDVVSELPSEEGMYVYRVKPNKEGVKALLTTAATVLKTPSMPSDEEMNKLVDDLSAENITHKLYISADKEYKKFVTTGTITEGTDVSDINSTINSKKRGDIEWTLVNSTKSNGSEDAITLHLEKTGDKYAAKVDAKMGSSKSTVALDANGDFTKKDTKIEAPTDAQDIMGLAAALYGMNSSSTTAPATDAVPAQ
ncbi:MAG: hypothetical protein ACK4NC_04600 [Candidatus Gracilibacteria bacterium]